ncbi:MAG TPA: hemolysin family protein [Gaiellaceae bacterium]|nr:hemolysin family protein [Gaiellaceae bacterium]
MTLALLLLAVAALILLNGFFVAAEYGLVTARMTRLQELADEGVRRARIVLRIIGDPPRFIAAMQLGVTATSLAIGALGEPVLERIFHPVVAAVVAVILAFLIITFLHVVIGELIPKGVALAYSERVALAVAAPVRGFFVLFHPLIWVLQRASEAGLRALGLQPPTGEVGVLSEAELKMLLSRSSEEGEIEHEEREMLYNVFDFADKEVSDVMVPRPEVVALSIDLPPEECLKAAVESPYTRYPVYRGSLDEIVGILHVRDLFRAAEEAGGIANVDLAGLLRPAHIVPETKDLAALLRDFRRTKEHMAVVVDEYGAMEGIATLEDLLEEIVGEIEDEFDLPDESVEQVDERRIRIDGTFPIDDFNEEFRVALPQEDYHTLAGFVFGQLGHAPHKGDTAEHDGMRFTVLETTGSRIERLEVEFEEVAGRGRSAETREQTETDEPAG